MLAQLDQVIVQGLQNNLLTAPGLLGLHRPDSHHYLNIGALGLRRLPLFTIEASFTVAPLFLVAEAAQ